MEISFTLWQLYPRGRVPDTHWIGVWVVPWTIWRKEQSPAPAGYQTLVVELIA
jgi:glucose dehydrogenase